LGFLHGVVRESGVRNSSSGLISPFVGWFVNDDVLFALGIVSTSEADFFGFPAIDMHGFPTCRALWPKRDRHDRIRPAELTVADQAQEALLTRFYPPVFI
jgi:hypothetical protein